MYDEAQSFVPAFKKICLFRCPLETVLLHIISAAQTIGVLAEGMQLAYC